MWNQKEIDKIVEETDSSLAYVRSVSDNLVKTYTKDLDDLMKAINEEIVVKDNPADDVVEKYFLELSNALYFINSKCEFFGFYEDISKSNVKLKYNEAYQTNVLSGITEGKKPTQNDNQIAAENASINEAIASVIYSRSFKIIKVKIDAAAEMVRTLSKILSKHMQEYDLNRLNKSIGDYN